MAKKPSQIPKPEPTKRRSFRCSDEDYAEMQRLAEVHADGNTSNWIRHRALTPLPKK